MSTQQNRSISNLESPEDYGLESLSTLDPDKIHSFDDLLTAMSKTAFGGRNLGEALNVLKALRTGFEALEDWELAQIIASLERVAAMLDADAIDASPVLTTGDIKSTDKRH